MKISEFRKLIKEEVRKVLKEGVSMTSPEFKKIAAQLTDAMAIDMLDNYDNYNQWLKYGMEDPNQEVEEYLNKLRAIASEEEIDKFIQKYALPYVQKEEKKALAAGKNSTPAAPANPNATFEDLITYAKKKFGKFFKAHPDNTYFELQYPKRYSDGQYYATFELINGKVEQAEAKDGTFPRNKGGKPGIKYSGKVYTLPNGINQLDMTYTSYYK
jgi:hypothetical protein